MQKYNFWFYYQIPNILYGITYYLLFGNLHKKGTDILGITYACMSRSLSCRTHVRHLNIKPCVLPQFLTLQLWIYIPLQVVLFSSFRRHEKKQKARHRVKIVAMFFAQELLCNIHRSNIACRSNLFVSVQALRDSCGYSVIKENITLPHFKHFLAYSWTETGFHSIFNSAVI